MYVGEMAEEKECGMKVTYEPALWDPAFKARRRKGHPSQGRNGRKHRPKSHLPHLVSMLATQWGIK